MVTLGLCAGRGRPGAVFSSAVPAQRLGRFRPATISHRRCPKVWLPAPGTVPARAGWSPSRHAAGRVCPAKTRERTSRQLVLCQNGQTGPPHSLPGAGGRGLAGRGAGQPCPGGSVWPHPNTDCFVFVTAHSLTPERAATLPRSQSLRTHFHRSSPPGFGLAVSLPGAGAAGPLLLLLRDTSPRAPPRPGPGWLLTRPRTELQTPHKITQPRWLWLLCSVSQSWTL